MIPFLVIALRLTVPLSILRWPFWGMIASMVVDAAEVIILDAFGLGFFALYGQQIDKLLDLYYLSFAAFVSLQHKLQLVKNTLLILFLWRFAGIIAFEITKIRNILFFAPNIFENFYLLATGVQKFFPFFQLNTGQRVVIFLVIAGIPKIIQEYLMHIIEFPTWNLVKHDVLRLK